MTRSRNCSLRAHDCGATRSWFSRWTLIQTLVSGNGLAARTRERGRLYRLSGPRCCYRCPLAKVEVEESRLLDPPIWEYRDEVSTFEEKQIG